MRVRRVFPPVNDAEVLAVFVPPGRDPDVINGAGILRPPRDLHRGEQAFPVLAVCSRPLHALANPVVPRADLLEHWRRGGSAVADFAVQGLQVPQDELRLEVLSEQVGRVLVRADLDHLELLIQDVLLHP